MLNCKVVQERLSCYVDGVVDEATLEMIEDHLRGCRECREELAALETVRSSMQSAAEVEPPAGLKFAIRDAISREESLSPECERVLDMLSEFVDGELAGTQMMMVREHTEHCESCAKELAVTRQMLIAAGTIVQVEPPADLKARIAAATVENISPLRKLTERVISTLRPARIGLATGAAVAASLVFLAVRPPNQPSTTSSVRGGDNKVERIARPVERPVADVVEKRVASAGLEPAKSAGDLARKQPRPAATPVQVAAVPEKKAVESKPAVTPAMVVAKKTAEKPSAPDTLEGLANAADAMAATAAASEKPADAAPTVVADADAKKDNAPETATKPVPTKLASKLPSVLPTDDRAMIRSLKQQLRMQKKGEGISVDLFGSKF